MFASQAVRLKPKPFHKHKPYPTAASVSAMVPDRGMLTPTELKKTANRKAANRRANELVLAKRLENEAIKQNDLDSLVTSMFLSAKASTAGNHCSFVIPADKSGRRFEAPICFATAPTRLDDTYQRKRSRERRRDIMSDFESILPEIKSGKIKVAFITPTYPNLKGVGFQQNLDFHYRLQERHRKNDIDQNTTGGHVKFEATLGNPIGRRRENRDWSLDTDGYNAHAHYLEATETDYLSTDKDCPPNCRENHECISKWQHPANLEYAVRKGKWMQKTSLEMFGRELEFKRFHPKTGEGIPIVDFRIIDISKGDDIFYEITKYLSKNDDLLQLPPEELIEIERATKGKKLITSYGFFNKTGKKNDANSLDNPPTYGGNVKAQNVKPKKNKGLWKSTNQSISLRQMREIVTEMCLSGSVKEAMAHLKDFYQKRSDDARERFLWRNPTAIITDTDGREYVFSVTERVALTFPRSLERYRSKETSRLFSVAFSNSPPIIH